MNLRIVLVGTTHSGNIGSVARAMKTFALNDLYLVNPKAEINGKSKALAANAKDVLYQAKIVNSLDTALSGCDRVVGTSARTRAISSINRPLRVALQDLSTQYTNIAVVFGNENSGLSNQELDVCDEQIFIPSNPKYSSLNLAQAVQVVAYEWCMSQGENGEKTAKKTNLATHEQFTNMLSHLEHLMQAVDYYNDKKPPNLLNRRLKHLFNRMQLDKKEINIIRGFFKSVEQKIGS